MLGWKKYPNDTAPEIEVATLTEGNFIDMMGFLMEEGKVVGGGLGAGSLSGTVSLTVNGVTVPEGGRVFKRLSDGTVGVLPSEKKTKDPSPATTEEA